MLYLHPNTPSYIASMCCVYIPSPSICYMLWSSSLCVPLILADLLHILVNKRAFLSNKPYYVSRGGFSVVAGTDGSVVVVVVVYNSLMLFALVINCCCYYYYWACSVLFCAATVVVSATVVFTVVLFVFLFLQRCLFPSLSLVLWS